MEISSKDRKLLEKFQKQAKKVLTSTLVESGFALEMNLSFDQGDLKIDSTQVDEDQLKALLVDFRPLISPDENVNIDKVFNLVLKNTEDSQLIEIIDQIRQNRKDQLKADNINIIHHGKTYKDQDMFKLFLNSEYMHLDDEKAEIIDRLEPSARQIGKHKFLSYIHIDVMTILNLNNAVTLLLGGDNFFAPE